ncbi:polysaccharide deacetylase [Pseudomonas gingeri NCPPB 3146 = LMG 5327]|uniref:Polysaccharide deacetylase family protein n=2 Tax=Pseudomonas gingeri TaxID=117681 RepID=A0A7Y7Y658_9PSED|nr:MULTISPECIES: polysaccharide deacetylase family protein [Pseudomonas]NVZ28059.1 polysaccharide deacetylase family protein [Pseudomonas gingeri]NVZ66305.1 polysaccharide deacetylase family protein [Pseudomonas gingeri]NVZ78898.1 polysaccharide deacetylase family protein [Pseudomonas gingeri]NWA06019.1 polysaccharide deacetylase family protein [Pseudomonas gingeri]NWC17888.1 polysaccharide deacetylase family protein [Pseudomonas gingeri]
MTKTFWPEGVRLVISVSMQFEAGGEAPFGAMGPFSNMFGMKDGYPDFPTQSWYKYGYREGIQRMLDLWDKYAIKVTSHMVGSAVDRSPEVAKEIVQRGHEAAAHGRDWIPQYDLSLEDERKFIADNIDSIIKATGVRPVGYNGAAMRGTPNTLNLLQDLGFEYHIDDVSRDEPFLIPVRGKDFVVVPYTMNLNDIIQFEGYQYSVDAFERQLHDEFDQLYEEAGSRRRMMSISTHDRIAGRPARVRSLGRFLEYALRQPGVVFMRKDEIARFAASSADTVRDINEYDVWARKLGLSA